LDIAELDNDGWLRSGGHTGLNIDGLDIHRLDIDRRLWATDYN